MIILKEKQSIYRENEDKLNNSDYVLKGEEEFSFGQEIFKSWNSHSVKFRLNGIEWYAAVSRTKRINDTKC